MSSLSKKFEVQVKHNPIKRTFDIFFSLFALLFCFPLFLIIAISIKLSSKGPIFFSHERIGRGGKPFKCYKFRTMYPDAEARLKEMLVICPKTQEEWNQTHKLKDDPRVTPLGSFLRKTSLDEFPQFWNVLKGDLSVVGPRPVVQDEIAKHYGIKAADILRLRPGITGPWQVSGRNDVSYDTRIMLDQKYVEDHSIILDLKLIAKTIPAIFTSKGAY
ncbi:sugar transferase [Parachlamydia sp. AcF125]|uniref:sugar transferase n=1 Tax=Parachlamydia sp. AcF125 TaxID=2795736 RepID=UPI001BC97607|nr:sugar transferase [Parachlamydia sp. AcF125]MBS4168814.1 putative sugar transferase EpsL [Parachlamydia sp. AcF125]